MSKWREIRCDFFNEEEERYYVDAWKTGNDNEEGKVIAKIDLANGTVEYLDEDARTDEDAQVVINEFLENGYVLTEQSLNNDFKGESEENIMMNLGELIWNDQSTMERVCKIVNGLWDGTVKLISNPNDGCLACQIGEYWFYFIGSEDENLKPEEVRHTYDVFTIAQMILEAMIDLDDDEYTYYCDMLQFA